MKKRVGQIVDILMYGLLLLQMLYIFTGNTAHELLGVGFFLCLIAHLIIKAWWFRTLFRKGKSTAQEPDRKKPASRTFFNIVTVLLIISVLVLMLSSMGVSRLLFTWFHYLGSADLHRYLATATLTLGVLHGCLVGFRRVKTRKKRALAGVVAACIAAASVGLFAVPYMNRHLRKVTISHSDKVSGEKIEWKGEKPLVVYFTRLGNTDFEPDVDAVSGASLLISDGELMGSNQLLADMVCDIIGGEATPITVTGERYPSSYNATISVASKEIQENSRPEVAPIDVSSYDSIILIYPLWWGTIPNPVATFLEENDFSGKTIYLIASQGSSGYGRSVSVIEDLCPGAAVIKGISIYCEDIPDARDDLLELIREWNK